MSNIEINKLTNLLELIKSYRKSLEEISFSFYIGQLLHLITVYYNYSYASLKLYEDKFNEHFSPQTRGKTNKEEDLIRDQLISSALSIYSNGRVCLKISEIINNYVNEYVKNKNIKSRLEKIRKNSETTIWVQNFVDIRNDITAHPVSKGELPKYTQLKAFGSGGLTFSIRSLITYHEHKKHKLIPRNDVHQLHSHLESLVPIYKDFFIQN